MTGYALASKNNQGESIFNFHGSAIVFMSFEEAKKYKGNSNDDILEIDFEIKRIVDP